MVSFLSEFYATKPYNTMEATPHLAWPFPDYGRHNPLAAMCHYRNVHSTERLPVPPASTAKEAPAGILAVAGFGHRTGVWK